MARRTLTVNLTVSNDCTITAPNIAFGSAPVISAFTPVTGQTINLACTKGSAYTVGLSDGQNPVSVGGRRRMISGSNYLAYDIFKSAGTTRWGSVGAARRASYRCRGQSRQRAGHRQPDLQLQRENLHRPDHAAGGHLSGQRGAGRGFLSLTLAHLNDLQNCSDCLSCCAACVSTGLTTA